MMPRLFTADVYRRLELELPGQIASMMPRLFTADVAVMTASAAGATTLQ